MENKEPFVKRADEYINLANEQLNTTDDLTPGAVSASFLFGAARFNAWVAACEFESADNMREAKEEVIDYFLKEYKQMLNQHIESHIEAFDFQAK